ncbi:hypothetical protein [Ralstonia phage RSP15]|uniref:hypothetical protein n=1 Tax=Ralstonia phage RSP15 TaxID=1785960 RepID=UPI00074D3A39|nr:hypothetical protein BH754_gp224 [Ralstonia phage RSP15]BAU40082.1 hypothetical protein [Ralstonia phage RSP15]
MLQYYDDYVYANPWAKNPFKDFEKEKSMRLQKGKFIVGTMTKSDDNVSVSANPHQHNTFSEAKAEAERLAAILKDKRTVVLEVRGICTASNVNWE